MSATGFVMAGGVSRRMGTDKALLAWQGKTLLDHAVACLRETTGDVRILSGTQARYLDRGCPVLTDALPDAGPLSGVLAGLASLDDEDAIGVFLAVDLPFVESSLLRALVVAAEGWDAVVPVTKDGPQPLCAVYRARARHPIERRLSAGERQMKSFWPDVRVLQLDEAWLRPFSDPARMFLNVNSPDDLARARR